MLEIGLSTLSVTSSPHQKSISAVTSFVFSSCDFVDHSFVQKTKDDPRSHTNQHETRYCTNRLLRESSTTVTVCVPHSARLHLTPPVQHRERSDRMPRSINTTLTSIFRSSSMASGVARIFLRGRVITVVDSTRNRSALQIPSSRESGKIRPL